MATSEPIKVARWTCTKGGIRVPLILNWPGHIPSGRVTDTVGHTNDLPQTLCEACCFGKSPFVATYKDTRPTPDRRQAKRSAVANGSCCFCRNLTSRAKPDLDFSCAAVNAMLTANGFKIASVNRV